MAGPRGDDPSSNYSGPKRNGSYAILEIKWGNAISSKSALHPARGPFSSQEPQNLETMTRARMAATRSCVCFVSNEDAGK